MMAKALADAGASRVYIVGRRKEALDAAAEQINKKDVVVPLVGDVASKSSLSSIASSITSDTGYLNLVVCNAGISGPQGGMPAPDTTLEEWQQKQLSFDTEEYTNTFNVNSTSVWYTAISMLKLLDEGNKKGNLKQSSQVVVTSSIASFNKKAPGGWAYGQSKAAATLASKHLSVVLRQWDIRCNCICPGCKCTPYYGVGMWR
jgi:NAD(P)-dependent dehydrogenase (short-subunit alcohol dehydrogenase family)